MEQISLTKDELSRIMLALDGEAKRLRARASTSAFQATTLREAEANEDLADKIRYHYANAED